MYCIPVNIVYMSLLCYITKLTCMELLTLEQQLLTMIHEQSAPKSVANPRSVASLLKKYSEEPLASVSSQFLDIKIMADTVALNKDSYYKSIGIPMHNGHLDWSIWIKKHSMLNDKRKNALVMILRYANTQYFQIINLMRTRTLPVSQLESSSEFQQLVSTLESILPAPDQRESIGKQLIAMWKDFSHVRSEEQRMTFLKQYPECSFWMYYFLVTRAMPGIRGIIDDALYLNRDDLNLYDSLQINESRLIPKNLNTRSVTNLLKTEYKLMNQKDTPSPNLAKELLVSEKLYSESIKIPTTDGHLDWSKWYKKYQLPDQAHITALIAFGTLAENLYHQIYYLIRSQNLNIDNLEQLPEFNNLVTLLDLALPAESDRKKTGEKLLDMWREIKQLDVFFGGNIQPHSKSKQVQNFFNNYPHVFLWDIYFSNSFGYPNDNGMPLIMFEALHLNKAYLQANLPRIESIIIFKLKPQNLLELTRELYTKFDEQLNNLLNK